MQMVVFFVMELLIKLNIEEIRSEKVKVLRVLCFIVKDEVDEYFVCG